MKQGVDTDQQVNELRRAKGRRENKKVISRLCLYHFLSPYKQNGEKYTTNFIVYTKRDETSKSVLQPLNRLQWVKSNLNSMLHFYC